MNAWVYSVLSSWDKYPLEETIRMVLNATAARGYSAINPHNGLIEGIYPEGYPDFALQSTEEMVGVLSQNGGLVNLWKDSSDIALAFGRISPVAQPSVGVSRLGTDLFLSTSLYIENTAFRRGTVERQTMADDAEHLFAQLCLALSSPYGFSMDENAGDELRLEPGFLGKIYLQRPPDNLFWLQYLSRSYAEFIDLGVVESLGAKIERSGDGVLVRFFDAPWLVDLARLVEINMRWKKSVTAS